MATSKTTTLPSLSWNPARNVQQGIIFSATGQGEINQKNLAEAKKQKKLKKAAANQQSSSIGQSQYVGPYQQAINQQKLANAFEQAGYTPEGQPKPLTRLADNPTWNRFANNMVYPAMNVQVVMAGAPLLRSVAAAADLGAIGRAGAKYFPKINPSEAVGLSRNELQELNPSAFKSDIDWGKWNREIPRNTKLMDEYKAIEETSKLRGTWMRNPDGSAFQGTPEQFVQQQSENFRKAFPKGVTPFYRGGMYHTSVLNPEWETGANYKGMTFGGDEYMARQYTVDDATPWNPSVHPEGMPVKPKGENTPAEGGLHELYQGNSPKGVEIAGGAQDWAGIKVPWSETPLSTDQIANYIKQQGMDYGRIQGIYDGTEFPGRVYVNMNKPGNYLKSMRGNNGMFDMNNPDIYKGLIPLGLGAATLYGAGNFRNPAPSQEYGGSIPRADDGMTVQTTTYPPIYVSDKNDPKLKSYQDSLYLHNFGNQFHNMYRKMAGDDVIEVRRGSPYSNAYRAKHSPASLLNNTGVYGVKEIDALWNEFKNKANKSIKPTDYTMYMENPDKGAIDLVTGRSFLNMFGVAKRAPGARIPYWPPPTQQVVFDPQRAKQATVKTTTPPIKKVPPVTRKPVTAVPPPRKNNIPAEPVGIPQQQMVPQAPPETLDVGRATIPTNNYQLPEGQPVYGPSGAMIGVLDTDSMEFHPDIRNTAARSKANQEDSDLIKNPEALHKYLDSKIGGPKFTIKQYRRGGSVPKADGGLAVTTLPPTKPAVDNTRVVRSPEIRTVTAIVPNDPKSQEFYGMLQQLAPPMYDAIQHMGNKYGLPKVVITEKPKTGVFSKTYGHYNSSGDGIITLHRTHWRERGQTQDNEGINQSELLQNFISEYAHHVQHRNNGELTTDVKWILNDLPAYITKGRLGPYNTPGAMEYQAHTRIEPKVKMQLLNDAYGMKSSFDPSIDTYDNGGTVAQDGEHVEGDPIHWWEAFNWKKWGLNDYSDAKTFNEAFRSARDDEQDQFVWNGNRYNTKLVSKDQSDLYWESKRFLTDYYSNIGTGKLNPKSSEFWDEWNKYNKEKYGTTWLDYYNKITTGENKAKFEKNGFTDEQNKMLETLSEDRFDPDTGTLIKKVNDPGFLAWYKSKPIPEIENMYKPTYFSIADIPDEQNERGSYDPKTGKLIVSTGKKDGPLNTNYTHELTHKAGTPYSQLMYTVPEVNYDKLNKENAYKSILTDIGGQNMVDYLDNNEEIEARKMSTLFYLYKNQKPYTNITREQLSDLYVNIDNLPSDVRQLFALYGGQRDDLLSYLNGTYYKGSGNQATERTPAVQKQIDPRIEQSKQLEQKPMLNAHKIAKQQAAQDQQTADWIRNFGQKPKAQDGEHIDPYRRYADSVLDANKHLNFVQRYLYPGNYPRLQTNKLKGSDEQGKPWSSYPDTEYSTHLMGYDPKTRRVYPTIVQTADGSLRQLDPGDEAWDYADRTGGYITFPTADDAKWFANNGYKNGMQYMTPPVSKPAADNTAVRKTYPKSDDGSSVTTTVPQPVAESTGYKIPQPPFAGLKGDYIMPGADPSSLLVDPVGEIRNRLATNFDTRPGYNRDTAADAHYAVSPILKNMYNTIVLNKKDDFDTPVSGNSSPYEKLESDLWYKYLGKPQRFNTYSDSPYKPSRSKDPKAKYIQVNDFADNLPDSFEDAKTIFKFSGIQQKVEDLSKGVVTDYAYDLGLGNYTVSTGSDKKGNYISYYDDWDVSPFHEYSETGGQPDQSFGIGKPFEVYGRVYYDKKTGKKLPNQGVPEKKPLKIKTYK